MNPLASSVTGWDRLVRTLQLFSVLYSVTEARCTAVCWCPTLLHQHPAGARVPRHLSNLHVHARTRPTFSHDELKEALTRPAVATLLTSPSTDSHPNRTSSMGRGKELFRPCQRHPGDKAHASTHLCAKACCPSLREAAHPPPVRITLSHPHEAAPARGLQATPTRGYSTSLED